MSSGPADIDVPGNYATVAEAVEASIEGDTIWVDAVDYVPELGATSVTIDHDLTILGVDGRPRLRQGHADEGFFKINGEDIVVTLENLELDGEDLTPALRLAQGTLILRDMLVHDTWSASVAGGAIHVEAVEENELVIEDSTLNDSATDAAEGGIIAALAGSVTVRRSLLSIGGALDYGGIVFVEEADLLIEDSTLSQGVAARRGGAVYAVGAGEVTLLRTRFEGNLTGEERGGGALYSEGPSVHGEDVWFVGNQVVVGEGGGAFYQRGGVGTWLRTVFCDNDAPRGGAVRLQGGTLSLSNAIFLGNASTMEGGSLYVHSGFGTLSHVSLSSSVAGTAYPGQAAWAGEVLTVVDTYVADHAAHMAMAGRDPGDVATSYSAYWNNTGGNYVNTTDDGDNIYDDSLIPPPLPGGCDPLDLWPPSGSPLLGQGTDGSDIGAFGGPDTWPDGDNDGYLSLVDCDDNNDATSPDAAELVADGVDQDCDGGELCYPDADQDGYGEEGSLPSDDLDCDDPGEAPDTGDLCPGFDDALDADADGVPDGCDEPGTTTDPPTGTTTTPPDLQPGPDRVFEPEPLQQTQVGCGCATSTRPSFAWWAIAACVAGWRAATRRAARSLTPSGPASNPGR